MAYSKILISGLRNTGKTTLFWQLQKELNWPTLSVSQLMRDYIRANGLQGKSDSDIKPHEESLKTEIDHRICKLLTSPHQVIIETRAFALIRDPFPNTLKVLLTADEKVRVARNASRENISLDKSAKRLLKKEQDWLQKISHQFGFQDFFDPKHYDLVVDTNSLEPEQVSRIVVAKIA